MEEQTNTTKKLSRKLIVFSKWCQEYREMYDERDGVMESACKRATENAMNKIGEYLDEILFSTDDWTNKELTNNKN